MLTTCSIRHLSKRHEQNSVVMAHARDFERRRCNHHTLEEPLSDFECLRSVVDPKGTKNNKFKLVVASQDEKLRAYLRTIPGVPLIYLKRSVMVMEPMAASTERVREQEERGKFRVGLKGSKQTGNPAAIGTKRKREDEDQPGAGASDDDQTTTPEKQKKKRKARGPSGPNPLSMKKSKKVAQPSSTSATRPSNTERDNAVIEAKSKRKRKHKSALASDVPLPLALDAP